MKIFIAKNSGFCFGVRRAVDMAYKLLRKKEPLYTNGAIIHNPVVMEEMRGLGLTVVEDLRKLKSGRFIIRSHGIEKNIRVRLEKMKYLFSDATCPYVKRIEEIIRKESRRDILLFGDRNHPEVRALKSYAAGRIRIIQDYRAAVRAPEMKNPILLSQTTKSIAEFRKIEDFLRKKYPGLKVYNTICKSTEARQTEASEIAKKYGCIFVVGGKDSANTRRLYEIAKKYQKNTFLVERIETGLSRAGRLGKYKSIAILSGASTPEDLVNRLKKEIKERIKNG